jgi:hypothetical protein
MHYRLNKERATQRTKKIKKLGHRREDEEE